MYSGMYSMRMCTVSGLIQSAGYLMQKDSKLVVAWQKADSLSMSTAEATTGCGFHTRCHGCLSSPSGRDLRGVPQAVVLPGQCQPCASGESPLVAVPNAPEILHTSNMRCMLHTYATYLA